jgi:Ner family transcriptional regulator
MKYQPRLICLDDFSLAVRPTPPAGMHRADIVAAVKKTGTNLRQLALSHGFGASTLRAALYKPHPRAQRLIAETIDKPLHELWPQWFDTNGRRIAARSPRSPLFHDSRLGVDPNRVRSLQDSGVKNA